MQQTNFASLSHMRWLAAWLVALSHIRSMFLEDFIGGGPLAAAFYFITGFGHAGVIVFFVLSGFLVGRKIRSLATASIPNWRGYMVDRFARIFVVAIPAIVLSAIALLAVMFMAADASFMGKAWSPTLSPLGDDISMRTWGGTFILLNELVVATPAVNGPLWSLAYEWTYYVLALAGVLLWRRVWRPWSALIFAYALSLLALAIINVPSVLIGGLVWLLGLGASIISDRKLIKGRFSCWLLAAFASGAIIYWRLRGLDDLVLGAAMALFISHSACRNWNWLSNLGERLAGFSFSLYTIHFPISVFCLAILYRLGVHHRLPFSFGGVALILSLFALVMIVSRLFAALTESRTHEFKHWLQALSRREAIST